MKKSGGLQCNLIEGWSFYKATTEGRQEFVASLRKDDVVVMVLFPKNLAAPIPEILASLRKEVRYEQYGV